MSVSLFRDDDWLPSGQGDASTEAVPVADNETLDLFPLTPTVLAQTMNTLWVARVVHQL